MGDHPRTAVHLARKFVQWGGAVDQGRHSRAHSPALLCMLLALAPLANADTLTGLVIGVADGDTITVLDDARTQHKVRLAGIDAPEKGQPFG